MAGLSGIIYPDIFQVDHTIDTMLQCLEHRGSDVWDTYIYKNIHLGCRGSHMAYNDRKTMVAMADGQIYNRASVQLELQKEGFHFEKGSAAELAVFAYDAWGEEFPKKIDGDYVIVIYDREKDLILLTRDRMGSKPLYWYLDQDQMIFASELKALLATDIIAQNPALDSIAAYLRLGFIPQDMTPIENVNKLLPGYTLKYSVSKGVSIHQYWSYTSHITTNFPQDAQSVSETLDQMLRASVLSRIPVEKQVGCYISGGLGSSSTAYYIKDAVTEPNLRSFSVGFEGQNEEDIQAASAFSKALGIRHQSKWVTSENFLDDFVKIVWFLDEPLADPNTIATWNAAKLAGSEVKVAFSGMGSDELLAGHTRYTSTEQKRCLSTSLLKKFFLPFLKLFSNDAAFRTLRELKTDPWQAEYFDQNCIFSDSEMPKAFPILKKLFDADTFIHKFPNITNIPSHVSAFRYFDIKTRLPDCYLMQYERLNSANGVDWRSPFFDLNIIEFFANYLDPKFMQESQTAFPLKELFKDIFSDELMNRPKTTRHNFLSSWLNSSDLPTLFHLLFDGSLVEAGIVSSKWLHEKTKSIDTMGAHFEQLWSILSLEVWFRLYINFPVSHHPPDISLIDLLKNSKPLR